MQAEGHHDSIVNLQRSTTISTLVLKENAPPLYLGTKVLKDKAPTSSRTASLVLKTQSTSSLTTLSVPKGCLLSWPWHLFMIPSSIKQAQTTHSAQDWQNVGKTPNNMVKELTNST
jgi:hypothetical protein